jgi:hypothetical protein
MDPVFGKEVRFQALDCYRRRLKFGGYLSLRPVLGQKRMIHEEEEVMEGYDHQGHQEKRFHVPMKYLETTADELV